MGAAVAVGEGEFGFGHLLAGGTSYAMIGSASNDNKAVHASRRHGKDL